MNTLTGRAVDDDVGESGTVLENEGGVLLTSLVLVLASGGWRRKWILVTEVVMTAGLLFQG